jgi:hypothetical protein
MIMTTKRKRLLLEKRRLKPIDETQLKGLQLLNGGVDGDEVSPQENDFVSPSRPILPPVT